MPPGKALAEPASLDELRTIQMLEESLGVKGLRQLRALIPEEEGRRILDGLRRRSEEALRELDDVVTEWSSLGGFTPPRPAVEEGLSREEVLTSFVELKESEAQLLRRAATHAPTPRLRERLERIAQGEEESARRLKSLL